MSQNFIQRNPKDLQTDNGTEFTNEKINKYLEAMEIEHTYSSPYHLQSNGSVEAFNKTIQNFLNEAYDNRISEKEEFNLEFETSQFMNYYNRKRIHTTTKQIPYIVFNAVKDEKILDLVKIETVKTRKRVYEDRPFKEGDIVRCSSRIEEAEGRKTYIIFFLKEKSKAPNMKDMKT